MTQRQEDTHAIKKHLQNVRIVIRYIIDFLALNLKFELKQLERITIICKVDEQQNYMCCNDTHTVPGRTISISQLYIRPIVKDKVKKLTESGAKLELSIDSGFSKIEKISSDSYNESENLFTSIEQCYKCNGLFIIYLLGTDSGLSLLCFLLGPSSCQHHDYCFQDYLYVE